MSSLKVRSELLALNITNYSIKVNTFFIDFYLIGFLIHKVLFYSLAGIHSSEAVSEVLNQLDCYKGDNKQYQGDFAG